MTELMKRYETETGKNMSRLMGLFENSEKCSKEELINIMTELYFYGLNLESENAQLRDQLRWRPVSEKPEKKDTYFAEVKPYTGCESTIITTAYFDGKRFPWHDVVKWLPIPPAPEGEVK